jgi:hypothetical protein
VVYGSTSAGFGDETPLWDTRAMYYRSNIMYCLFLRVTNIACGLKRILVDMLNEVCSSTSFKIQR